MSIRDAVRILSKRVSQEGGQADVRSGCSEAWFRAKVRETLDDPNLTVANAPIMDEAKALIERKRLNTTGLDTRLRELLPRLCGPFEAQVLFPAVERKDGDPMA